MKIGFYITLIAGAIFCNAGYAQDKLYANEFPLKDIKLLPGTFQHARDLNIKVLLEYDVDRLLAGYRKEAGLEKKAESYTSWDGLDGHIGGHYLSALAMNYGATGNSDCRNRMEYMLTELKACQDANTKRYPDWAKGYVGAVPNSNQVWAKLKNGDFSAYHAAWVPWYNVHKMFAGLRDAWLYAGNEDAKIIFLHFCEWALNVTGSLKDVEMQAMLDMEHGGMNEILADAYEMTGEAKYLTGAKRFSHRMLLDSMAVDQDNLDNKHANTQVPKAIGFERIGELANDDRYKNAGSFFWETVTGKRSLAFGGNSRREFFPSTSASTDFVNDVEGPESCNSYNMLKLTEDLFRVNPVAKYADYYEKTLYNHILSTQHPVHGGYVYFTPVRPRHYRVYSSPNEAMWCCVGSGMENHGKYNQFIYTHSAKALYVNLFISAELDWEEKKISLRQETQFPDKETTTLTLTKGAADFSMMIRYPSWVTDGALKLSVNGKIVKYSNHPSSYISIRRSWKKGDIVKVTLPMHDTILKMPNVPNYIAFMHGPILLGAKMGTEDLKGLVADNGRWGHIASGKKLPLNLAPIIIDDNIETLTTKLKTIPAKPLSFTGNGITMINRSSIVFEPFYKIHDSRYMIYWMALSNKGYRGYLDSIAIDEKRQLELQDRTVDFVAPGEQQPEADHFILTQQSTVGNLQDEYWRDARNDGFFSYELSTKKETNLALFVRYWGAEWGDRKFDIYIDDQKLISEDNTGKWNQSSFYNQEYQIPETMLMGKEKVRIKFQALSGNTAGAVYYIRLLRVGSSK